MRDAGTGIERRFLLHTGECRDAVAFRCLLTLIPDTKNKETEENRSAQASETPFLSLGFADYLSVAQGLMPVAWNVVRPMLTAWGIQKAQRWIIKKLFGKKK